MEGIITAIIVIYILVWVIENIVIPIVKNFILPISIFAFWVVIAIALIYAFCMSLKSLYAALIKNKDPWAKYIDTRSNAIHGAKRGYFFGPGLNQMNLI